MVEIVASFEQVEASTRKLLSRDIPEKEWQMYFKIRNINAFAIWIGT